MKHLAFDTYGGDIFLPAGIQLYRRSVKSDITNLIWFGFHPESVEGFDGDLQQWEVQTPILLPFCIDHFQHRRYIISRFPPQLCGIAFEDQDVMNLLDWKQDHSQRERSEAYLENQLGWPGWVSSIEDKIDLEICFTQSGAENAKLRFKGIIESSKGKLFRNSLREARVRLTPMAESRSQSVILQNSEMKDLYSFIVKSNQYETQKIKGFFNSDERQVEAHYDLLYHLEEQMKSV